MKSLNYWQQFTHTGKVDDYLTYVKNKYQGYEDIQKEDAGVRHHAGICMCNRNDTQTDAYRGI